MSPIPHNHRSEPALLLLINDSEQIDALVRSGERRVLHWSARPGGGADRFYGDLDDPATYECAARADAVTAVIDLPDLSRAEGALRALRDVRPDAAVLLLSDELDDAAGDGTLARAGSLRDVLRLDLEEELQRLESERRVFCLRRFVEPSAVVPILIHPDPDPDAIASAFALRAVLGRNAGQSPVVTLGDMRRPENRRMADLLELRVSVVSGAELRELERLLVVDTQPAGLFPGGGPGLGVIDHHPPEAGYTAEFLDLRPGYGAVSSMLTEYLRAACESEVGDTLAAALLHGIKTDTDLLTRSVSPEDVQAYAFLQERADTELLRRIERPSYSVEAARSYGAALAGVRVSDGIALVHAGDLPENAAHLLPELADFCLNLQHATLAVASGFVSDELVVTLRYGGRGQLDAGAIARRLAAGGGQGGGHAAMARVSLPRAVVMERFGRNESELPGRLLEHIREVAEGAGGRELTPPRRS